MWNLKSQFLGKCHRVLYCVGTEVLPPSWWSTLKL